MAVELDDLLIFRMRGKTVKTEEKTEVVQANGQKMANVAKEINQLIKEVNPKKAAELQVSPKQEYLPAIEEKSREVIEETDAENKEERRREIREKINKNIIKTKRMNIEAAKGLTCVNHPWRAGYAVCNYCERAFCYADLVEYGNNFYCLEDIDKVSASAAKYARAPSNIFANISALFFITTAAVLGYFIYDQSVTLVNYVAQIGVDSFFSHLNYIYVVQIINLTIVTFSFVAAVLVFSKSERGYFVSIMGVGLTIIILSYEYINSNVAYLLFTDVVAFLNIAIISLSRMSSISTLGEEERDIRPNDIEWPRIETF